MSEHSAEKDAYGGWTGCVHCGQELPHEGTGWRESSRCRLFQRIAEEAWEKGYRRGGSDRITSEVTPNPYATRILPPAGTESDG